MDIREKGAPVNGRPQILDRRLFMQLTAFGGCRDARNLANALQAGRLEAVLYQHIHDPQGVGLLALSEDPSFFAGRLKDFLLKEPFGSLSLKPEFSMLGRTYSSGHEPDLEDWLLKKPRRTALNPAWPWAIWYPLRRSGAFFQLSAEEQGRILKEHGAVGHAFGEADLSHDIRLACFGLDKEDNDFVIGLVGKELYPLSATVQAMRKTQQTSAYIQKMGPFFVGKALWQGPFPAGAGK